MISGGFRYDPKIAKVTAHYQAACCLMHNRKQPDYQDYHRDLLNDLKESISIAREAGVADDKIILDPGVGFGKSYEQNLDIIRHVDILHGLGYPILLGTSRKSVVGLTLNLPADQRVEGTMVTTVFGVQMGCAFVRVHDIEANRRAIRMTQALMGR